MDTSQWPQGIGVVNHHASTTTDHQNSRPPSIEKKPTRPQKEHQAVNCPRCSSTNTKFCYYNNYSLTQPRYFCKTCRRYWTAGGSLRNVPVGGGSRKNKRSSSSSSSNTSNIINHISSPIPKKMINNNNISLPSDNHLIISPPNFSTSSNPKINIHEGHDLNLAYNPSHYNGISEFVSLPFGIHHDLNSKNPQNPNSSISSSHIPVMEFLKGGNIMSTSGIGSYSNSVYNSSGFPPLNNDHDHYKPSLSFSLDGLDQNNNNNGYIGNNLQGGVHGDQVQDQDQNNSSRVLFPFEELKPTNDQFEQQDHRGQGDQGNGYWNGMLAGGSW